MPAARSIRSRKRWRATPPTSPTNFANFESHRHNIELGFAIVFIMLSLTLLISAVWMGLTFANQLVGPIRRLIRATDEVASGNLYVQVPTHKSEGDLGHLGETFNKMTGELRQQHPIPDRRQRAERRAPRLHRGRAVGRAGGRRRRRSKTASWRSATRPPSACSAGPGAARWSGGGSRSPAQARRDSGRGASLARAPASGPGDHTPRAASAS